ncbi:MAG: ABC transporter ATP-binding protein [Candidatus Shapirobacteria bacterium]|jgi:putative ABC transport system ATP-binding protein
MTKSSSLNNSKTILELKNVFKTYFSNEDLFYALKNVSFKINEGDFISITGPSGSGKSTLMHIIGLLDNPTSGEVLLNRKNISQLPEKKLAQIRNVTLGFVFQQFNLLAKTSSLENVILPLVYSDVPQKDRNQMGIKMLTKVGLQDKFKNTPNQLSGGQQQRVAIARALINNPQIILADEPTGNLDSKSGAAIMKFLHQLNKEGKTIVFVTHDSDLAKQAKKIIIIKDGQII